MYTSSLLESQSTSQSKDTNHTIASVTCCKTCSQTEGPSPGAPAQLPVGEGEEQPDPKMAGEGCPGWCMPNHSCLFGLQAKNSNPAGDGLRQNCTRCLFLHSGVSIKFYWLLSECRAASCHRSGPGFSRLLSWVQKVASSGEKSSVLTDGSGTSRRQVSRCLVPDLCDHMDLSLKAAAHNILLSQVGCFQKS